MNPIVLDVSSPSELARAIEAKVRQLDGLGAFVTFNIEPPGLGLRYVQVICSRDSWLYLESISNVFIYEDEGMSPLSSRDHDTLRRLRFTAPQPHASHNWQVGLGPHIAGREAMLAETALRTLIDVHAWQPGVPVEIAVGSAATGSAFFDVRPDGDLGE
jgi:hypothetical protein